MLLPETVGTCPIVDPRVFRSIERDRNREIEREKRGGGGAGGG